LSLSFLVYFAGVAFYAIRDDPNSHGDWLVHYGDGFTRRGLIGEIVLTAFETVGLEPRILVATIQITIFALLLALVRNTFLQKLNLSSLFLLFVPGGFLYMFAEPSVVGRKEYLFFLGVATWWSWIIEGKNRLRHSVTISALWGVIFLSHESAILFFPGVLLTSWFLLHRRQRGSLFRGGLLFGPLAAWAISTPLLLLSSSRDREVGLCDRVLAAGYSERVCDGALGYMDQSVSDLESMALSAVTRTDASIYIISLLFALAVFALVHGLRDSLRADVIIPVTVLLLGLVALGLVASDWGRWLHMFIVCLGLIGCVSKRARTRTGEIGSLALVSFTALFLLLGFAFNGGEFRSPMLNLLNIAYFLQGGMYSVD
jgi:hypothetical protein